MDLKRIFIQVIVGAILFTVVSVILEGSYDQQIWLEKGMRGAIFGVLYGVFLIVKEKFIKKME